MQNQLEKYWNIKTRIILGFLCAFIGATVVGIIAYRTFHKLSYSVEILATTDDKGRVLSTLINDLNNAEHLIWQYSIDPDSMVLNQYFTHMNLILRDVDSLKQDNSYYDNYFDKLETIEEYLEENIKTATAFAKLESEEAEQDYYKLALSRIKKKELQGGSVVGIDRTNTVKVKVTKVDSSDYLADSLAYAEKQARLSKEAAAKGRTRKKRKGFLGIAKRKREKDSLKRILQRKNLLRIEEYFEEQPQKYVVSDRLVMVEAIKKVIQDIRKENLHQNKELSTRNLELIEANSNVLQEIQDLLSEIEEEQMNLANSKKQEAKTTASNGLKYIFSIGIFALLILLTLITRIFHDLRIREFFKQNLLKAQENILKESKAKEEFLANMSHEIRTPLNAVLGFGEQLADSPLSDNQKKQLLSIQNASEHLMATVNDVLDLSKIHANKLSIESIRFDFNETIEEACNTLQLQAERRGIQLILDLDPKVNKVLMGDPFRIKQILFNLVGNAIKFTHEGSVTVRTVFEKKSESKLAVCFEVEDTGIGIPEKKIKEIFNSFSQSDNSVTRNYGGTGLGLTICEALVGLLEGQIEVESTPGKGSTFRVKLFLPIADKKEGQIYKKSSKEIKPSLLKPYKFLMVDDDPTNLELSKIIFEKWGLTFDLASSANIAIDLLNKSKYDLLLTDIQMPGMSGIELSKFIRKEKESLNRKIPIIAITANIQQNDLKKYKKMGINDYLLKPYKSYNLFHKMVSLLPNQETEIDEISVAVEQPDTSVESKKQNSENSIIATDNPKVDKKIQNLKLKQAESNTKLHYDLTEVMSFTGDDKELLDNVIKTFLESSAAATEKLKSFKQTSNWETVKNTGHQLMPSYAHFGVKNCLPLLKKFDNMKECDDIDMLKKDVDLLLHHMEVVKLELEKLLSEESIKESY